MIEFICEKGKLGTIPEPYPAVKNIPDWWRCMSGNADGDMKTIKKCMPVFDAMTTGWIIPLAYNTAVEFRHHATEIERFQVGVEEHETITFHHPDQVKGHPREGVMPMKWSNPWVIKTPPGVSCLITSPFAQAHEVWRIVTGVVDTDTYPSPINFPFFPHPEADGLYKIAQGEPLAQVIPFMRDVAAMDYAVRAHTRVDIVQRRVNNEKTTGDEQQRGWYKREIRSKRKKSEKKK